MLKHKRPHTSCRRGKRVRIELRDGTVIVEKFFESTDKYVFLDNGSKYLKADIKAFGLYRGDTMSQVVARPKRNIHQVIDRLLMEVVPAEFGKLRTKLRQYDSYVHTHPDEDEDKLWLGLKVAFDKETKAISPFPVNWALPGLDIIEGIDEEQAA